MNTHFTPLFHKKITLYLSTLIFGFFSLLNNDLLAQKTINGTVVDAEENPIVGASVILQNASEGTSTDVNGYFTIQANSEEELIFSYIGFEDFVYTVTQDSIQEINIILEEKVETLAEVYLTGYQKIDKRKATSSIVAIEGKDIEPVGNFTLDNMLQGKVAGLQVLGGTSTPGATTKIRIRGSSSILGSREPVWVVDGIILEDPVPLEPSQLNSLDNINLVGNAISFINPEDIERIDVLKDASATALYGVRAANGVIVITTKKGKKGPVRINYSANLTLTERPFYDQMNRMNSQERVAVSKEIEERNLNYPITPVKTAYVGLLQDFHERLITRTEFLNRVKALEDQNTDWFKELFRTSFSQKHNLSISGSNGKTGYYASVSNLDNAGTTKYNNFNQTNALLKINTQINDKLEIGIQGRMATNTREYQHSKLDIFQYAWGTSRTLPLRNKNGELAFYNAKYTRFNETQPLRYNILNELDNSGRQIKSQSFNLIGNLNYKITPDLNFSSLLSYNESKTIQEEFFNDKTFLAADMRRLNLNDPPPIPKLFYTYSKLPFGGILSNNVYNQYNYSVRSDLTFDKTFFDVHSINSSIGTEFRANNYSGIQTKQYGYLPDRGKTFFTPNLEKYEKLRDELIRNTNIVTDNIDKTASFYGTISYGFDQRYILNFNIRSDASNQFGQDARTKFLPVWALSGRWNIMEEFFLEDVSWLDNLALRASFGLQGNVVGSPHLIAQILPPHENTEKNLTTIINFENPDLTWEKTQTTNIGLDMAFLKNRVNITIDYYQKKGRDMIGDITVSPTNGSTTLRINGGTIENTGIDFALNINAIKTKDFFWQVGINGAKNTNEMTHIGRPPSYNYNNYLNGNSPIPGEAIGTFYSYKFDGLDTLGLPTFKDTEKSEIGNLSRDEYYKKVLVKSGSRIPTIEGGFSTTFRYKNWGLSANFTYSLGSTVRLTPLYDNSGQRLPQPEQNFSNEFVDRWQKRGDEKTTNIPVLSNRILKFGGNENEEEKRKYDLADNLWQMYNYSDIRTAPGDFLRIRTLSLQYSLDKSLVQKLNLAAINVRLDANNLYTFKSAKLEDQEPDQIPFTNATGAIPIATSFALGININF